MSRLVDPVDNTAQPVGSRTARYAETLVKYVPAEIVAGYLPLSKLLSAAPDDPVRNYLEWGLVVLGLVVTPLYLLRVYKPEASQLRQVWISTVAFALWALALGEPFTRLPFYRDYAAAVLLGVFTWVVALFPPRARIAVKPGSSRSVG